MRSNPATTPWAVCLFLALSCLYLLYESAQIKPEVRTEWKVRTVVKVDTLRISAPMAVFMRYTTDTIHIADTIVQREEVTYQDSTYRAVVSGYRPRLDKLEIYPRTITHTITPQPKAKPWGIGLQAGYGWPHGAYIGVGISYNLVRW